MLADRCLNHAPFPCTCSSRDTPYESTWDREQRELREAREFAATPPPPKDLTQDLTTGLGQTVAMLTRAGIKHSVHPVPKKREKEEADAVRYVELRDPRAVTAIRMAVVKGAPGYARFYTLLTFSAEGFLIGHEAWE